MIEGAPARTAVVLGSRAGRSVVTAAAIIVVAVFGGFIFSDSAIIRPIASLSPAGRDGNPVPALDRTGP